MDAFPDTRLHRLRRRLRDRLPGHGPAGQGAHQQRRPRGRPRPQQRGASTTTTSVLDLATDVGKIGRLGRGGSVPVGYYKDPEKSAATFLEIDGERYSVPGDFARIEEDGKVTLLGRGSNCINTGGEKVYPEEVEMAIKAHPDVYDVLVVGVPDEKYGQSVAAVVAAARGGDRRARGPAHLPAPAPLRLQAARARSRSSSRSRATRPARRSTPGPRSSRWPPSRPRSPPSPTGA